MFGFTKEFFQLEGTSYPTPAWTEGDLTTTIVKWQAAFLRVRRQAYAPDSMLAKCAFSELL